MSALLVAVPLAPLAAALVIIVLGRRLPRAAGIVAALGSAVALAGLLVLLALGEQPTVHAVWLETGNLTLSAGLHFDELARFMAVLVAGISLLVSVYAVTYMEEEHGRPRFFSVLAFFVGAMLTLVLADSFLLLFAAWEGVGLASFLLIGFWYTQDEARRAAQKAFLLTRLGDVGLLLGWLIALLLVGSTDVAKFLTAVENEVIATGTLTVLALLFVAGVIGKSAQLPLTAWLPAATAGPTPVSALIHSATMVAAGVYLLLRLFPLLKAAPGALTVVLWIGGATALFAALVATVQYDLKRVLAWSTVSQLGEMMLALGVGGPLAAAFHLATHATFKSTLFLAAGAIEHGAGSRDLRDLGNLARSMPITGLIFGVATLALVGVPPLSGFWSEDKILADTVHTAPGLGVLMLSLIFLAGVYISRASAATFLDWPEAPVPKAHDPDRVMTGAMAILALAAVDSGLVLSGRLVPMLPFESGAHVGWFWRIAAVLAGLTGLWFGTWRVRRFGPVPAFGVVPVRLEQALTAITQTPRYAALTIATVLNRVEGALDSAIQGLGSATTGVATTLDERVEWGLDSAVRRLGAVTVGVARIDAQIEAALDRAAYALGAEMLRLAAATDAVERFGFSDTLDAFGRLFRHAGDELRAMQTGKLYLYTLGLFLWVLAVGILGTLLWR